MKNIFKIVAITFAFASCNSKTTDTESTSAVKVNENIVQLTDAQLTIAKVSTGKMEQKRISSTLKVNGSIDVPPQNMVSISVPLGGYLKSTKLLPGMHINKGETIAVMEDKQYIDIQEEYLTAKAKLVFVEAEFHRQEELNKSKASSDKVLAQTLADYTSQKVRVKSLSEKLKLIGINPNNLTEDNLSRSINITAPIDGYISAVNVNIGKYVNPSDILFELVNPQDIHLALSIFEKDINRLFIGQKVIAYTNNNPERKHDCEIILIGKEFSKEGNVEVHCHFSKYDATLIPGMFMNAEIEVEASQAHVLPLEAIVSFESKQYVFVVKDKNTFEMIEVKIGNTNDGYTEIVSENAEALKDLTFVTKGAYSILMKMKNTEE